MVLFCLLEKFEPLQKQICYLWSPLLGLAFLTLTRLLI